MAAAIADPTTNDDVRADHEAAVAHGSFGVPTLVFDDESYLYGPVITPAPIGTAARALWDLVLATRQFPHLYEIKRPKTDRDMEHIAEQFTPYLAGRDWQSVERPAK